MRIALVADVFPPLRSSGAVQLRDLALELARQGHEVVAMIAAPGQDVPWRLDRLGDVQVLRLRTAQTKDTGYARRALGEWLMPFAMKRHYRRSPLAAGGFDGVVWYSPTIFLGPLVSHIKQQSCCPSYLIVRDIFPQWAVDMGLMSRGPAYRFFDRIARYQYSIANVIGVQTPGNLAFFENGRGGSEGSRIEVLQNWLAEASPGPCSIRVDQTSLAGRHIFVYAGNMGVAQQMDKLLELAQQLRDRRELGFLFVGRGSEVQRLRRWARQLELDNLLFYDEIDPEEVPGLYTQCHVGLVCLDARHKTHNIPGKFLTYMQAGLPVLASINKNNDLAKLVAEAGVGRVSDHPTGEDLPALVDQMLAEELRDPCIAQRCRSVSDRLFSARAAAEQIIRGLVGS